MSAEYRVMTEMLAVLADSVALGGCDTDPGIDALFAGAQRLEALGCSQRDLLKMAMSGWMGALEAAATASGITTTEAISRYASALTEAAEEIDG